MAKNKPAIPTEKINPKRKIAKLKRNFGMGAIERISTTQDEWSKKHDPLFGIKGIERYRLIKGK